jgi:dTDP-4-dehydrorhamnose 3,5-epimerase
MKLKMLGIADLVLIELNVFRDERGWFIESYNQRTLAKEFAEIGVSLPRQFVQDNQSHSRKNVLRGLHYQRNNPQGKLLRVVKGKIFDVVVDLRQESLTFGHWTGVELSGDEPTALWIPPGMAHGFYTLSDDVDVQYKCTEFYEPGDEACLLWNDAELAIKWPLIDEPIVSEKDRSGKTWKESFSN